MKSYFLPIFLFLLFSLTRTQENEETESGLIIFDNFQIASNPQLQGLVSIGVQSVTKQAIQDGSLLEGNYQVSEIVSAMQNQDNYRFEVEITDEQGNTADLLFFVNYDSSTGTTEVTSYEVVGNEEGEATTELGEVSEISELGEEQTYPQTETEDGFVILDPSIAQTDTTIAGILNVGVQEVTRQASRNGSLYYSSSYDLVDVHSVQQNVDNPNEYRFEVSVRDNNLNTIRMEFDLVYDEASNTLEILSWGFPDHGEEDEIPAGYQEVEFNLNDPVTLLYHIEEAGLQVVVATGVLEGIISSYSYEPTNIRSVSMKFEGDKLYYRFDLDAADGQQGNTARFTYVVSYDPKTSTAKLEEMKITNIVRAS